MTDTYEAGRIGAPVQDSSQTLPGPSDATGQSHMASAADGDAMASASEVLVHAQGSIEDVLEVLRDIEETWHEATAAGVREGDAMGIATRTFGVHGKGLRFLWRSCW